MLTFHKFHGTGNDFILFDNRSGILTGGESDFFADLCHRRFGIGADGVILLNLHPDFDFEMYYVNADGHPSSMCGNGGRCIVAFAKSLGLIGEQCKFIAIDGPHEAEMTARGVRLKMGLPHGYRSLANGDHWIDTGSPHYVRFLKEAELSSLDVKQLGSEIRYADPWKVQGTNVNFVQESEGILHVRTYERGVEDETWACGTGVTAVASIYARLNNKAQSEIILEQPGGRLWVHVSPGQAPWLEAPATFVFSGTIPHPKHAH